MKDVARPLVLHLVYRFDVGGLAHVIPFHREFKLYPLAQ